MTGVCLSAKVTAGSSEEAFFFVAYICSSFLIYRNKESCTNLLMFVEELHIR